MLEQALSAGPRGTVRSAVRPHDDYGPFAARNRDERRMTTPSRSAVADELLRRFAAALRASQLYSKGHPAHHAQPPVRSLRPRWSRSTERAAATAVIGIVGEKDHRGRCAVEGRTGLRTVWCGACKRKIGIERITSNT